MSNEIITIIENEVKHSDAYKRVLSIIKAERLISDRIKLIGAEHVEEKAMGSGGVGQVKVINGYVYVQIGSGHSIHNYAPAVKIGRIHTSGMYKPQFIENYNTTF